MLYSLYWILLNDHCNIFHHQYGGGWVEIERTVSNHALKFGLFCLILIHLDIIFIMDSLPFATLHSWTKLYVFNLSGKNTTWNFSFIQTGRGQSFSRYSFNLSISSTLNLCLVLHILQMYTLLLHSGYKQLPSQPLMGIINVLMAIDCFISVFSRKMVVSPLTSLVIQNCLEV